MLHEGIADAVPSTTTKAAAGSSARRAGARSAQQAACCGAKAAGYARSRPAFGGSVAACLKDGGSAVSVAKSLILGAPRPPAASTTNASAASAAATVPPLPNPRPRMARMMPRIVTRSATSPPSAKVTNPASPGIRRSQASNGPRTIRATATSPSRSRMRDGAAAPRDESPMRRIASRPAARPSTTRHARPFTRPGPQAIAVVRSMSSPIGTAVVGIILAGGEGKRLFPLTRDRAKPAVPFGGRYRIVDVVLSNFVNSGIYKLSVITQYKAGSLMQHLARGWQLAPQIGHYVAPVPPAMNLGPRFFEGSADAVLQNLDVIENERPAHVCVFGADHIYKMDVRQMLRLPHRARGRRDGGGHPGAGGGSERVRHRRVRRREPRHGLPREAAGRSRRDGDAAGLHGPLHLPGERVAARHHRGRQPAATRRTTSAATSCPASSTRGGCWPTTSRTNDIPA